MPPSNDNCLTGGKNTRANTLTFVDRLFQGNIAIAVLTGQAYSGHPGLQYFFGVRRHTQCHLRLGFVRELRLQFPREDDSKMHMHIHHAGNQPFARCVYNLRTRWNLDLGARPDLLNPLPIDQNNRIRSLVTKVEVGSTH